MNVKKFNWKSGWVWDCPRQQRLAMWIELEVSKVWHEIVKLELQKRELTK